MALVAGGGERVHQLGADLVAAGADARADRDDDVRRPRAELARRARRAQPRPRRGGSTPAGVHGGHGAGARSAIEQRHAVGGANRDRHIGGCPRRARPLPAPRAAARHRAASPSRITTHRSSVDLLGHRRRPRAPDGRRQCCGIRGRRRATSCRVVNRCGAIVRADGSAAPRPRIRSVHSKASGTVRKAHVWHLSRRHGHYRNRHRRHRNLTDCRRHRALRRSLRPAGVHRRRDRLLPRQAQLRRVVRRAIRGQGSGDEGARAPAIRAACSGRRSRWSGTTARRRCSSMAAPRRASRSWAAPARC